MNLLQGKWQIAVNDIAEHTSQWETFSILLRHEAGQAFTDVRRGKRAARSAMNDVEALALVRKIFFPLPVKQHRCRTQPKSSLHGFNEIEILADKDAQIRQELEITIKRLADMLRYPGKDILKFMPV